MNRPDAHPTSAPPDPRIPDRSRVTSLPRESWELRRDLRAYEGEIALLTRSNDQIAAELEEAHRRIARLAAENARLTRQGPRWWEWAGAWLYCRVEALDRWIAAVWQ